MWHDLLNSALGLASLGASGLVIRFFYYIDGMAKAQKKNERRLGEVKADVISLRRELRLLGIRIDTYPYDPF